MKIDQYVTLRPTVTGNESLREPQIEALRNARAGTTSTLPRAAKSPSCCRWAAGSQASWPSHHSPHNHTAHLLIAPNLKIADQLLEGSDTQRPEVLLPQAQRAELRALPGAREIRGTSTNISDLEEADIVITNIQQLQRAENTWLAQLPADFFDLIMFDEGHHNVAESWDTLGGTSQTHAS